jgi:hypothetical protein
MTVEATCLRHILFLLRGHFREILTNSQKLAKDVNEHDLDEIYRSEAALTIALMGLLAEESLIAQRLGKLGRKKTAA